MLRSTLCLLIVFYAGAVFATGRSWFGVLRGAAGFSALRDLTGIGDPVALRRLFGMARADGLYQVSVAAVFRHRRRAGVILTDLPVHLLFLAALAWAALYGGLPATMAIVCAAAAHALVLGGTAVSVLAASRQTLLG
jgi:uncharacterized membrane protein